MRQNEICDRSRVLDEFKRILVVDDDDSAGTSVKSVLEQAGFSVGLASNAQEAWDQLDARETCFVLLDLDLPEHQGWDVLDRITRRSPTVPLAIMTSQQGKSWGREIASFVPLLQKPLEAAQLLSTIHSALEEPREVRLRRFCAFLENCSQFPELSSGNPPATQEHHEKANTGNRR